MLFKSLSLLLRNGELYSEVDCVSRLFCKHYPFHVALCFSDLSRFVFLFQLTACKMNKKGNFTSDFRFFFEKKNFLTFLVLLPGLFTPHLVIEEELGLKPADIFFGFLKRKNGKSLVKLPFLFILRAVS